MRKTFLLLALAMTFSAFSIAQQPSPEASAIQNYEKALALDPRLTPSMEALKTLKR